MTLQLSPFFSVTRVFVETLSRYPPGSLISCRIKELFFPSLLTGNESMTFKVDSELDSKVVLRPLTLVCLYVCVYVWFVSQRDTEG